MTKDKFVADFRCAYIHALLCKEGDDEVLKEIRQMILDLADIVEQTGYDHDLCVCAKAIEERQHRYKERGE